jgi:two-component system phosphate regulon sensor histidine kinase PhoR
MELRRVKLVIAAVSLALLSLIVVQVFWAFSTYRINENSFNARATEAMRRTAELANENLTCFEMFSKVPINPHDGFYMIRQKWSNDQFIGGAIDTIPMYFAHGGKDFPFRWDDIKFSNPVNLEMVLKFHYLFGSAEPTDTLRGIPSDVNASNFRSVLSDKKSIVDKFDTLMIDSILHQQLALLSIREPFHFGFMHSDSNKLDFNRAGSDTKMLLNSNFRTPLTNDRYFTQPYDLVLYFDHYRQLLFAGMRTQLVLSLIVVVILLISFYLFIRILYRQRKLSEMKNDFINNMTHEFKTPLANISVALETLGERHSEKEETDSKLYRILGLETERLRENIEKILQVARFEKEKIHFSFETLDLHQVVQKAASSFEAVLQSRKAKMDFDFRAQRPLINADETHLINTVCNLIDNSIKYSRNGVHIRIQTENIKDGILLTVIDNGEGIAREDQKKIFDKFYRTAGGDVHNVKGFGLGLSYVKSIIDSHQGKVSVKSQVDVGTEFEIYLPYHQ